MDATVTKPESDSRKKLIVAIEQRVNRAIRAIRLLGKLDSRKELDVEDIEVIRETLSDEVCAMETRLLKGCKSEPDWKRFHG